MAGVPEQPFLFFRGERGHFRWWSSALALERLRKDPGERALAGEPAATAWLRACADRADPALAGALDEVLGPPAGPSDVWIATRSAPGPVDAAFVHLLASRGGAVVWEPGERLLPELTLWVRPTLIDGSASELLRLLDGMADSAPRLGGRRWLRRRLARLRALVVTSEALEEIEAGVVRRLGESAPRVLPFPRGRW